MPTLQEYLSDPANRAGFFNPDTGEFSFSDSHKAIAEASVVMYLNELKAKEQELKESMAEGRKPKPTTETNSAGAYIQKGESGEVMKDNAEREMGTTLAELQSDIKEFEKQMSGNTAITQRYGGGEFMLSMMDGMWHVYTAFPSKLNTEQSKKFLSDLQSLVGSVDVVANNINNILDARQSQNIDSFIDSILKKVSASFSGVNIAWFNKKG